MQAHHLFKKFLINYRGASLGIFLEVPKLSINVEHFQFSKVCNAVIVEATSSRPLALYEHVIELHAFECIYIYVSAIQYTATSKPRKEF
jgi:hypothetical protein